MGGMGNMSRGKRLLMGPLPDTSWWSLSVICLNPYFPYSPSCINYTSIQPSQYWSLVQSLSWTNDFRFAGFAVASSTWWSSPGKIWPGSFPIFPDINSRNHFVSVCYKERSASICWFWLVHKPGQNNLVSIKIPQTLVEWKETRILSSANPARSVFISM